MEIKTMEYSEVSGGYCIRSQAVSSSITGSRDDVVGFMPGIGEMKTKENAILLKLLSIFTNYGNTMSSEGEFHQHAPPATSSTARRRSASSSC
jgi:hypothetical protein